MTDTNTHPTDLRQQPGVCPDCEDGQRIVSTHANGFRDTMDCVTCNGTSQQQPSQPESGEVKRYLYRHDGLEPDMGHLSDFFHGHAPVDRYVPASDFDRLQSALTAAQREIGALQAACRKWRVQFDGKDLALQKARAELTAAQQDAGMWEREYRIEHGRVEHLTADVIAKDKRIAELETENRQLRAEVYE